MPLEEGNSIGLLDSIILKQADEGNPEVTSTSEGDHGPVDEATSNGKEGQFHDIEFEISQLVNQTETSQQMTKAEHPNSCGGDVDESHLIEVIEADEGLDEEEYEPQNEKKNQEEKIKQLALQQLEAISNRSRKKQTNKKTLKNELKVVEKIDNNDLIAILQGGPVEQSQNVVKEEVTIEGEGQFEVMDIDETETESTDIVINVDKIKNTLSKIDKNITAKKKKQDTKPDLVLTLAKDWTDDEIDEDASLEKSNTLKQNTVAGNSCNGSAPVVPAKPTEPAPKPKPDDRKAEITPFKRTRVIKRKIIWDPDAPESQFSYASLITKRKTSPNSNKKPQTTSGAAIKKKTEAVVALPKKKVISPAERQVTDSATDAKRPRSVTPVGGKKRKLTEIDRLLGDEGAANMLNSLEKDIKKTDSSPSTSPNGKNSPAKKRAPKSKASASWDYVYNQQSVDSMIVRRRSNSSYSSTTSPLRNSFDSTTTTPTTSKPSSPNDKKSPSSGKVPLVLVKSFEFAKPEAKNNKKPNTKEESFDMVSEIKKSVSRRSNNKTPTDEIVTKSTIKAAHVNTDVLIKKHGTITQIMVDTSSSKMKYTFTTQIMSKLTQKLEALKKDKDCKIVVITSGGLHFCQGIDFSDLVNAASLEKRKKIASDLAGVVTLFLQSVANFPKPIVAGLNGNICGVGVMLLPLFDITIANEKSTMETFYVKMGQMPEGYCYFNASNTIRQNSKMKLIWLCEKLNAAESVLSGLITKISSNNKSADEAVSCAKKIMHNSIESYSGMKACRKFDALTEDLQKEQIGLIKSWSSQDFVDKLKTFITKGSW